MPAAPLAITPNYISHPVFPYAGNESRNGVPEASRLPNTNHTPQTLDSQGERHIAIKVLPDFVGRFHDITLSKSPSLG